MRKSNIKSFLPQSAESTDYEGHEEHEAFSRRGAGKSGKIVMGSRL